MPLGNGVLGQLSHLHSLDESVVLEMIDRISGSLEATHLAEIPARRESHMVIVGDTHGDWNTLQGLVQEHVLGPNPAGIFVLLGDYTDRTPRETPYGSVANALCVLTLVGERPGRVIALRGNHEARARVSLPSSDMEEQSLQLWGTTTVADRLEELFERLPLAATAENGTYLAHAGFPISRPWQTSLAQPDSATWLEVLWNDVDVSPVCGRRGIDQTPIGSANLTVFLEDSGHTVFVRGHDPYVAGRFLYDQRLLTLQTTRVFRELGIYYAKVPLDGPLKVLKPPMLVDISSPISEKP